MTTKWRGTWLANALIFAYVAALFVIVVAAGNDALPHPRVVLSIVLVVPVVDLLTRPWRGAPFNLDRRQH